MIRCPKNTQVRGRLALLMLLSVVAAQGWTRQASAAERKFLVMLATSPKENDLLPVPLQNPVDVSLAYFGPSASPTFADYWREISYGDVTVTGTVTDWIQLPWRITPVPGIAPSDFIDLDSSGSFVYGVSERFTNTQGMIRIDTDGDPSGFDNGPSEFSLPLGSLDTTSNGWRVWRPGGRFLDIDGDGRWDGLDEAGNAMDFDGDGLRDLLGPWLDLDGDRTANNAGNCVYLEDSDNDGNPDCCPNGPGNPGCRGFPLDVLPDGRDLSCEPTSWTDQRGATVNDCNGNLIPDECDVDCEREGCQDTQWYQENASRCTLVAQKSPDRLPGESGGDTGGCTPGTPDGIPDECQFANFSVVCCDGTVGAEPCVQRTRTTTPRCEYDDTNDNNIMDVAEPFEAFVRTIRGRSLDPLDPVQGAANAQYIRDNYPGDPDKVLAISTGTSVFGIHDPMLKSAAQCTCPDGTNCKFDGLGTCADNPARFCRRTVAADCAGAGSCQPVTPAVTLAYCQSQDGRHVEYTPPDRWFEARTGDNEPVTNKMWVPTRGGLAPDETFTCSPEATTVAGVALSPEPVWYRQAWRDRYCGENNPTCCTNDSCVPPWNSICPLLRRYDGDIRRYFKANAGGLFRDGTGWTGEDNVDVIFETCVFDGPRYSFDQVRILPEELDGVGTPLLHFDGFVEFDDLPSSKYHRGGDLALGEVTSPFTSRIFGEDINDDGIITAAGPYALSSNGNLSFDAGNVVNMELLTWRVAAPFNNGNAWEWQIATAHGIPAFHPYAAPLSGFGENLGFRDFNLDGLLDQGEKLPIGSENYTTGLYPFNARRIVEDAVEALDFIVDFDDFIDTVSLKQVTCAHGEPSDSVPDGYPIDSTNPERRIAPVGLVSGVVFLSNGSNGAFASEPRFVPIHNEDAEDDPDYSFPLSTNPQLNWNLFFHDLVVELPPPDSFGFLLAYVSRAYLRGWQGWPYLFDFDVFKPQPQIINTPIGQWDIMAGGGEVPINLVHSIPPLKESFCTQWIDSIDLTTILTPGVDTRVTLPRSEFVRDDSYYFFENPDRAGERYYFWSAGSGFDVNMPGSGVLILHTDIGSNNEALPSLTQNGTRFNYVIVQADGLGQLDAGIAPYGDAGDPWPGATNRRVFDCSTNPASQWYSLNTCTGLEVRDVVPDGSGSAVVTFNWQPTNIPSLSFIDPPGGTSVNNRYQVRFRAADVFGGTRIRLYYSRDVNDFTRSAANLIGEVTKSTPGFVNLSRDWNITGLADGQYFVFAHLIPGMGADGNELAFTAPREGRNNVGDGQLTVDGTFVTNNVISGAAHSQTWKAVCNASNGSTWVVSSTVTQLEPDEGQNPSPGAVATTGQPYTSIDGSVRFTIQAGSVPFSNGDSFVFTTTGLTAMSQPVNIIAGRISESPTAVISATPLNPKSGEAVSFDGRQSFNPEGRPLNFLWSFGDGTSATGSMVDHVYRGAQTFTATLRVTDPVSGRFGESSVDIVLPNNSPKAVIRATPTSGKLPLAVTFTGAESSDAESPGNRLIYNWEFGNGTSRGTGVPGELSSTTFTYSTQGTFVASLTVTDEGGKSDTASVTILAGNSRPVAVITNTALNGTDNHEVIFNAINSSDPDGDAFTVLWNFGDGQTAGPYPPTGPPGTTNGNVPHVFKIPQGQTSAVFRVTATLTDARGAVTAWPGVDVRLSQAATGVSTPFAIFTLMPDPPVLNQPCTLDASLSFDRPGGGPPAAYAWNFGDGTTGTGRVVTHTYTTPGAFRITLTVSDAENPPNSATTSRTVTVADSGQPPPGSNQPPKAAIDAPVTRGPVGSTFSFDGSDSVDADGDSLTYRWLFGDGATANGVAAAHAYTTPGTYEVRLTVRDSNNASDDATVSIVVTGEEGNLDPVAIIGSGRRTGPAPLRLTFNGENSYDPDGDTLSHEWRITQNDALVANLTGAVVTYTFTQVGEYAVALAVDDGNGGTNSRSVVVTVTLAPSVNDNSNNNGNTNDNEEPEQPRPGTGLCGLGMLPALFVSLLGLSGMVARRRTVAGR